MFARKYLAMKVVSNPSFPVDAWENREVALMRNDPNEIIKLITPVVTVGKMKHGIHGALALYFLHNFGEKDYARLMDLPRFREQIDERDLS